MPLRVCVCIGVGVRVSVYPDTCTHWCKCLCLKHIPNCKWLSNNTGVNEPEPSIGAGSRSQVGNLLVWLSGEDRELVLILMNNSPVTFACLHHSLQRLVQVTDGAASLSHRSSM